MGCFDTVHILCPRCNTHIKLQSKGGECELENYDLANAPLDVLCGLMDEDFFCDNCNLRLKISITPSIIPSYTNWVDDDDY